MSNLTGRLEKETKFYNKIEEKLKSLPKVLNEYYFFLRAGKKSYTSIGIYINNLLNFSTFACGEKLNEDFYLFITVSDVERYFVFLETKADGSRMGDDILQQRWSTLNHFFSFLIKKGYVTQNPIIEVERPKNQTEHEVVFLTKVEINRLLKAINNNPISYMGLRDKTLFSLAIATGLRASALTNINVTDVDFEGGIIKVIEKRKKVRNIAIGENIQNLLKEWINVRSEVFKNIGTNALFVSRQQERLSERAANWNLKKYCEEAGITKKITLHKLRASCACLLVKNNIPLKAIQEQLGHNSSATTMRYIGVFDEDRAKARSILDNIF